MNKLAGDLPKSCLVSAFTGFWPSLGPFPGLCATIVFTAGPWKVSKNSAI